ncbi:DEAD/DEAH box helicase [Desulfohalobiaceae bacterium Ax17]|uniref:DEAD/DEAH box helicase n=1 Tax=Desulfovulcanus ferrireducens TaxID=2831190 RepID=UPI00207BA8DE|nr:DEAD/DEAH box helicase [Desulfovulcanus ferrireducens]MBT8763134.1 DEAD/DEAH box helicase [Desulfovulcanus ferrireducens]
MSLSLTFDELGISDPLLKAIDHIGYKAPSPIQAKTIPLLMEGHNLLGQAQTGTGKTAAFALPILTKIDTSCREPQVLVLTPTRELAIQVSESFQSYGKYIKGLRVLSVYGGASMVPQLQQLRRGVHIVVGTPGRVMDHIRRNTLSLNGLSTLVLDEADEMLNMGFLEDIEWILERSPKNRQMALFSATMPKGIREIALRHLPNAKTVKIKTQTATVESIEQQYLEVAGISKFEALARLIEVEDFDAMLVFVRTRTATVEVAEQLKARGYSCGTLNGDMSQAMRERTIEQLKNKSLDIVIATDVAARGLDVRRISHVVNYDMPYDSETYIHRIGRTARAGQSGKTILFVSPQERRMLRTIERATRQKITPMGLPTLQDISKRRIASFKQQIIDTVNTQKLDFFRRLVEELSQESDKEDRDIAAALAYLLQRENPLHPKEKKQRPEKKKSFQKMERAAHRGKNKQRPSGQAEAGMERYRIDVGREHGVTPGDIVGAIANEANIDGEAIGHIKIYDDFSTVDLASGMPKFVYKFLKKVRVRSRPLNLSPFAETSSDTKDTPRKSRSKQGKIFRMPKNRRK